MKASLLFYPESCKKMSMVCSYLNTTLEGKTERIPPAYNPENQRLVIMAIKQGKNATDEIVRFCREINKKRSANVAFIFDAPAETQKVIMDSCREAGTNVIDDVLELKTSGLPFMVKFTDEEKKAASEWLEKVQGKLIG